MVEREREEKKKIRVFASDHSSRATPRLRLGTIRPARAFVPPSGESPGAPGWRISSRWANTELRRKREKTVATMPDAVESGCSRSRVHEPLFLHRLLGCVYRPPLKPPSLSAEFLGQSRTDFSSARI